MVDVCCNCALGQRVMQSACAILWRCNSIVERTQFIHLHKTLDDKWDCTIFITANWKLLSCNTDENRRWPRAISTYNSTEGLFAMCIFHQRRNMNFIGRLIASKCNIHLAIYYPMPHIQLCHYQHVIPVQQMVWWRPPSLLLPNRSPLLWLLR